MRPWLYRGLAVLAGLAAAFAQPPWGFLPGLLGYALILWLVDRSDGTRPLRSAFFRAWLAGVAYFAVSTWWMAEAFFVDPAQTWMAPSVIFVSLGLGVYWGAAAALYRALAATGPRRVLLFAGLLAAFEWLRGHLLTGFPWDLPGETWRAGSPPSQAAAVVGAYGLTWITLVAVSSLAEVRDGWRGRLTALGGLAAIAGLYGYGVVRLSHAPAPAADAPRVRIVQANVPQKDRYDDALFRDIIARHTRLTMLPAARRPDIVVWPEGAIPAALDDYLGAGAWTRDAIAAALAPGQTLMVGGYRIVPADGGREKVYNSLVAVRRTPGGLTPTGLYDKYRLVPFGEFLPLDSVLAPLGIKQLVHVGDGFDPGPRPRPISPAGVPVVQPLICYESLFPGFTREGRRLSGLQARWIVNVSNDSWFGTTSGPWQHLNIASYRAIEEGLPMVRSTPTGVSAVVDAYGRIRQGEELGQDKMGVIDAPLPPPAGPTVFGRLGDAPFALMLLISLAGLSLPWRATKGRNSEARFSVFSEGYWATNRL